MAVKDSFPAVRGPSRRRILIRQITAIVVLAVLVAGTIVFIRSRGSDETTTTSLNLPAATGNGDGPESRVSFLERLIPPPPERIATGPAAPRSLADLARRLPLERAVAQLFLFGFGGKDATAPIFQELKRLDIGGLVVDGSNYDSAQQLAALTGQLSLAAGTAKHLPPWVMAEQDGGDYSQFADLPPAQPPGGYSTAADAAAAFTGAATTLKALGINGVLEPELDVAGGQDSASALSGQALSDDPDAVAEYARRTVAACRQLQMLCAAKHFPGLGAADTATDEGTAQVGLSMDQLMQRDVVPFKAAIKAGISALVIGEGLYEPDDFVTPAALSSKIIGGLLRKRLRFGGLAITDDLADPGVSSLAQVPDAAVDAIKAGADMAYISGELSDQEAAYTAVLNAVRSGEIPESRVRQSLLRVLIAKRGYRLLVTRNQQVAQSNG
jgi:beta-N-acetylhexosaminidase